MVILTVKRGDEARFLCESTVGTPVKVLLQHVTRLYNAQLRIDRLAMAMESLAEHGICKPPEMQGLTDEQVQELKLRDTWSERCYPSGGARQNPDPIGKRTGNAPSEHLAGVLVKTAHEARQLLGKDQAKAGVCLTEAMVAEAFDRCRGAVMIVYPMGLPPHEETQQVLQDKEELSGRQAALEVIGEEEAQLWWAGKELLPEKSLGEYVGKNEKTKVVVKLQKRGGGAPSREPVVDEETQKKMMAYAYRKQEEMKKLEAAEDDSYLDSGWADPSTLRRQLHGLGNIKLR